MSSHLKISNVYVIGTSEASLWRLLKRRIQETWPEAKIYALGYSSGRLFVKALEIICSKGSGVFLFSDSRQYNNPNLINAESNGILKIFLLLSNQKCLKATVENYSQEDVSRMDGYEMQAANWSKSSREKH